MAGRKPRLFDTVTKKWIDFDTLQLADSLFNDKSKNNFITTKEFGVTSRYRYDEPLNSAELLQISLGGKPKSLDSTASKVYSQLKPETNLEASLNAIGINPILDRDYNFVKHPDHPVDTPIYYPNYDEYWGYNDKGEYTNKIPENIIGSKKRRALLGLPKDAGEEKRKWLSEYYNYIDGGFESMTQEAQESYMNNYANTNQKMWALNPNYDPKSPHVVMGRALTVLAGKNAIDSYLDEAKLPKDSEWRRLSGISNTELAKLSEKNERIAEIFDNMIDYYMLKYYGKVADKYKDEPLNIGLDIEKHGDYSKIKNFIREDVAEKIKNPNKKSWEKLFWGTIGTLGALGNSLKNNLGVQVRDIFSSDDIVNELRNRASNVINTISNKIVAANTEKYLGDTKKDAQNFDKLAEEVYNYYKQNDLQEAYSPEEKRNLLIKFEILQQTVGQEKAEQNLLLELLNRDYKEQGTFKRLGYTANNLLNTIGTTVGNIANMAWYLPLVSWDVLLAGAEMFSGKNFFDTLGDELYDTWNRALDNSFVNYLSDVEHTGSWLPYDLNLGGTFRSLDYYKLKGINANTILRAYGDENAIFTSTSTLYDVVPVAGYMIGSSVGSKGFNIVGDVMRGLGLTSKTLSVASKIGEVSSSGATALGYRATSYGTALSGKFLNGASKFIDATAPAMATAGMDYGYAKNNYDEALSSANTYVESQEFTDLINDKIHDEEGLYLIDKALISLLDNPELYAQAESLKLRHNSERLDMDKVWDTVDAALQILLLPYKDEYLNEVKKIATFNAGLTFGLTILPDVHMTNTWRKAMFSAQSRGAMNNLAQKTIFKPIGKVLGIKPNPLETHIEGIIRKDGKWLVNGKPMTRKDLLKIYLDQSKAGFVSNYLQDVGVAAGNGLQESMLNLYIDQRFGADATDGISYDISQAYIAAADKAGLAFGDYTSFRDGLYGAVAPWIISPARSVGDISKGISQAKLRGTKDFVKSLIVEPILKNSLLYNATFGSKDIVNKENLRRQMLHNTIETWLNANGSMYMNNIGSLLNLSKQEKEAIKNGDYTAFNDSRLGQTATAAIMLSLIKNFQPIKSTIMAYMKDRASRKEVSQSDMERLDDIALLITALREQGNEEGVQELLNSISNSDKSIISDLIEIRKLNQDIRAKDSRTEVLQLNDLRINALKTLDLIDKANKYYLEADAKFGDSADLVVKQEYARLKLYQDELQTDVENKAKLLKKIESGIVYSELEKSIDSTVPLDDTSVLYIAKYKGSKEKLLEGIEANKRKVASIKEQISELKSDINSLKASNSKNEEEAWKQALSLQTLNSALNVLQNQEAILEQEGVYLQKVKKEVQNREDSTTEENLATPIIAAKDMLQLSEQARLELLTSKNLSKKLLTEVDKFKANVEFANDIEETNVASYIDLLQSKISNTNALRNIAYEGELTPQAIERLNRLVAEARVNQARDFYAKSFEIFAEEAQYHVNTEPNLTTREAVNEQTGQIETVTEQNESQPEISVLLSDNAAYEKFLKAYKAKVKDIQQNENSQELMLGLNKALEDANNALYKKMKLNQQESNKALRDLDKYVDPEVFSLEERRELTNMIDFATVYKSIPAENIMQSLTSLNDDFLQELSQYLKEAGFNSGSITDLRNRILQYNHNITNTIASNKKAEEERTKKKEVNPEVPESRKQAAEKRFVNSVNTVASYTMAEQDVNMTPIRELLKALGILDADNIKTYSNNLLNIFREIIVNSEANNVGEMEKALDDNFKKVTEDPNVLILDSELTELSLLLDSLKREYNRKVGIFKTFNNNTPPPANGDIGSTTGGTGESTGRKLNVNSGVPYAFADLSWLEGKPELLKNNIMWQILNDAHIDDFLRTFTVTPDTKIVFITAKDWENKVAASIELRAKEKLQKKSKEIQQEEEAEVGYNPNNEFPIIGAIKLTEFREGCIPVTNEKGLTEYYQPLGLLPATGKVANTTILRTKAIELAKITSNNDPYVITLEVTREGTTTKEPLTTTITVKQNGVTIDIDAGPQPVELTSDNVVTANNFCVTEDGTGAKTNQVPSINKKSTNRANWAVMQVQKLDATENENGQTLSELEGDSVLNFNSRTQGFTETLLSIINIINENLGNLQGIFNSLNSTDNKVNTALNSRIEDEKTKVALASFISLANGYRYYIAPVGDGVNLAIMDSKNKPVIQWTIVSNISEKVVTADLIIKDLSTLKTKDDNNSIAKWQVSWGNFNLDQKSSPLKVDYIKRAVKDRILYAYNVKATFDILVTPVKDRFAEQQIEVQNREAEKRAALDIINSTINPVTGQPNAGTDIEGAISLINSSNIDGEAKDNKISMLQKLNATKLQVEARRKGEKKLAINQHKSRHSTTGTTAIINPKENLGGKSPKHLIVTSVGGNVVDASIRDFFNPALRGIVTKESFIERFKDVFNETTVNNLWDAIENLNSTFVQNGWSIISTGIYTVDESLNNKQVGEIDLLAMDALGNFHIIDIKTYNSNSFELSNSNHNYPAQVSLYRADIMRNTNSFIPEGNLHIFALKLDMDEHYYDMTTDSEGVDTITKKSTAQSKIQIKKGARFELYDVKYIGDTEVNKFLEKRALNGSITTTQSAVDDITANTEIKQLETEVKEDERKEAEEMSEDKLTLEELAELTKLAQAEANQSLTQNDYLHNKSTDELEDLGCRN